MCRVRGNPTTVSIRCREVCAFDTEAECLESRKVETEGNDWRDALGKWKCVTNLGDVFRTLLFEAFASTRKGRAL